MNRAQAAHIMFTTGWLSEAPADFREEVVARSDLLQFPAGTEIYGMGDVTGGMYGVVAGSMSLFLPTSDGQHDLGHIGRPGFWTGDFAAVTGRARRLSVSARSDCEVMRLPRAAMLAITEKLPNGWPQVMALFARNSLLMMDIIDALKRDDPVARIAMTLLNLIGTDAKGRVTLDVRQSELASIAHLSRATVNAGVASLETRGWLRRGYGTLEITDLAALSRFARGH